MLYSADLYVILMFITLGLIFGSFYNVVILRSLSGESIIFPGSKCPKCSSKLKPWHNIPVLSYIFLRGKCAFCNKKISIQYPLIELITAFIFTFSYLRFGLEWKTLFSVILLSCMLIMSMTDLKEKLVDCNIAIGLAIVGTIYNWLVYGAFLDSIVGAFVAALIMELLAKSGHLIKKGRAFGEADTYIAGALGACFGLSAVPTILIYTLVASMLFIIPAFLYKQYQNNNKSICILFIVFTISALAYKTLTQNLYTFSALSLSGIALATLILKNLKTEENPLYLPLVPAFSLAALYFLFF